MKISSLRLASYCAVALAAVELLLGVTYLLLPAKIGDVEAALFQAGSHPGWYILFYSLWALTGLIGLAVVRPATQLLAPKGGGWSDWAARLAYLAFAVTAIQGVHSLVVMPGLGQLFQGCHSCTASLADQQTLAKWLYIDMPLDPGNWLTIGALALWILALSVIGLGAASLPKGALYLGVATGMVNLANPVASAFGIPNDAFIVVGVILVVGWFAWIGLLLRRAPA